MEKVLAIVLAGGVGQRLYPLTQKRAKPAVPFGGTFRVVDIALSNCVNSDLRKIYLLTQHKALVLNRHVHYAWNFLPPELGEFIETISPSREISDRWYMGTADAVYQNAHSVEQEGLPYTLILGGDHIYKMDYSDMLKSHVESGAAVTVGTTQIEPHDAVHFGIAEVDPEFRIVGFEEKPKHGRPARSRFNPERCSASMGIYLFSTPVLLEAVRKDANTPHSSHDFGKDVLPGLIRERSVYAYDFVEQNTGRMSYWRDIGTLEAYFEAHMDLVSPNPPFSLHDRKWPIRTLHQQFAPARFSARTGEIADSLISPGCVVGGRVTRSVLSPGVRVAEESEVRESILFANVNVGQGVRMRRAIIESHLHLPEGLTVGFDPEADRKSGFFVSDSGLTVVHALPASAQAR